MGTFSRAQYDFLSAVHRLATVNPFSSELAEAERAALGDAYQHQGQWWSFEASDPLKLRANAWQICERLERMAPGLREAMLRNRAQLREQECQLYESAVLYMLYHRVYRQLHEACLLPAPGGRLAARDSRWQCFEELQAGYRDYLETPDGISLTKHSAAHMFAIFFQFVRAFRWTYENIIGASAPAARLRASVWESIFGHDIQRYRSSLYLRMGDFVTLITGPSGTGKELVARAIALSRYVPFDPQRMQFGGEPGQHFHPVNVAALSSTLVESELFGHRKGAFTGAVQDRKGWLESCPALGAVFLDEIGELSHEVQVKLLRVLETRSFTPVGDTVPRSFAGKLLAATNRDLGQRIRDGQFRDDLYYRLCSDLIRTPSLHEQLLESPAVLDDLVLFLARRVAADDAESLAEEAVQWIRKAMSPDYSWPGNYRELDQCVRNILLRREYHPLTSATSKPSEVFAPADECLLTADELLRRYCTVAYFRLGSYEAAAQRLGIDRRTVRAKLDPDLLTSFREGTTTFS